MLVWSALEDMRGRIRRVEARITIHRRYLSQGNFISNESVEFAKTALHVLERSLKLMRVQSDRLEGRQRQKQETKKALAKRRLRIARLDSTNENRTMRPS